MGNKHDVSQAQIRQSIDQGAFQSSAQSNLANGNVLFIDLSGEHNHINMNKAQFVLDSQIDQSNAAQQFIDQTGADAVAGVVFDKHGRVIGTVDVKQDVTQTASQDSVQVNGATGNVLTINLSGEHNHANLNKAVFVLESGIDQANTSGQQVDQTAAATLAAPVDDGHGHKSCAVLTDDAFQFVSQDASQESAQLNAAVGNLLTVDLSGQHNHANLNGAEFELTSAIDQVNTASLALEQHTDTAPASHHDWMF
jgi:hypothetical protein